MENKHTLANLTITSPRVFRTCKEEISETFASPKFTRKRNVDLAQFFTPSRKATDMMVDIGDKLCYISPKKNIIDCDSVLSLASAPGGRQPLTRKNCSDKTLCDPAHDTYKDLKQ